jgi:xylan 1,4-beta-xylosidase
VMSYWTFSDVFEEQGVVKTPFYGGFGLLAEDGIPKPAFNAFKILHRLGEQRIDVNSDSALLTRKKDGSLVLAVWNYAPPEHAGAAKTVTLHFLGGHYKRAIVSTVDPDHGDVHSIYEKMGSPRYPSQAQIQQLKRTAEIPPAAERDLKDGELTVTLPSYGLAVVEVR